MIPLSASTPETFGLYAFLIVVAVGGGVGALLGKMKNRIGLGFALGALLSWIGWIIILFLRNKNHPTGVAEHVTQIGCGLAEEKKKSNTTPVASLIGVLVVAVFIWFYFGGGLEQQTQRDIKQVEHRVVDDAIEQYDIAKRSGSAMDAYVHASLVRAAYLQAKDEQNYRKWKVIEEEEAQRAGMPTR